MKVNWNTLTLTVLLLGGGVALALLGGDEWATTAGMLIAGALGLAAPTSAVSK